MENKESSRKQTALKEIGKVLVNFGSLTFASLVLGTIIRGEYDHLFLFFIGGGIAAVLTVIGIITLTAAAGVEK